MTRHPLTPLERAALWVASKSCAERNALRDIALPVGGWLIVAVLLSLDVRP